MENIAKPYYDEEFKSRIVKFQIQIAERLLRAGLDVVMDGGYWSKAERDELA